MFLFVLGHRRDVTGFADASGCTGVIILLIVFPNFCGTREREWNDTVDEQ